MSRADGGKRPLGLLLPEPLTSDAVAAVQRNWKTLGVEWKAAEMQLVVPNWRHPAGATGPNWAGVDLIGGFRPPAGTCDPSTEALGHSRRTC